MANQQLIPPKEQAIEYLAISIQAFINKMGNNREKLLIDRDYEFTVHGFTDVKVNPKSLYWLNDTTVSFNGEAIVIQSDSASDVHTKSNVAFSGVAFFVEDIEHDNILYKIDLTNLKLITL